MAMTRSLPTADSAGLSIVDERLIQGGEVVSDVSGAVRTGVLPVHTGDLVFALSSMAVSVAAFVGVFSRTGAGVEKAANNGATTVALDAAPNSNARIDVVWARCQFTASTDTNNLAVLGKTTGTAAQNPQKPPVPAGAIELATVLVPAGVANTQANGVVITATYQFTAMKGGVVVLRNQAEQDACTPHNGAPAFRLDTNVTLIRASGAWKRVNTGPNLIASSAFSGTNVVPLDLFSNTFDKFTIEIDIDSMTDGLSAIYARLRSNGTADVGANYFAQFLSGDGSSPAAAAQNAQTLWQLTARPGDVANIVLDISSPASARRTTGIVRSFGWDTNTGPSMAVSVIGLAHGAASIYNGILFTTINGQKIAGRYRVYGHYAE